MLLSINVHCMMPENIHCQPCSNMQHLIRHTSLHCLITHSICQLHFPSRLQQGPNLSPGDIHSVQHTDSVRDTAKLQHQRSFVYKAVPPHCYLHHDATVKRLAHIGMMKEYLDVLRGHDNLLITGLGPGGGELITTESLSSAYPTASAGSPVPFQTPCHGVPCTDTRCACYAQRRCDFASTKCHPV
jgi:hypothetical protein